MRTLASGNNCSRCATINILFSSQSSVLVAGPQPRQLPLQLLFRSAGSEAVGIEISL
jgi:hypothetical protein